MKIKILVFISLLIIVQTSCNKDEEEITTVRLGAILDFSGDYSETGLASKASIQLSLNRLNQRYEGVGSPVRFTCEFEDTHMDTSLALEAVERMYDGGIRLLVAGPNTSAELKAVKPFVDEKQMVVINSFSTAPSLAIPDDYIFRILPDDNVQGQALIRMMQYDSIEKLIPVWRQDTYGTGLYESVRQRFQDAGGTVLPGVGYNPEAVNFDELMDQAEAQVRSVLENADASKVGVILISYQEAAVFMKAAAGKASLSGVRWYGCDTNVQRASLIADPQAAAFASMVRFKGPIMGIGTASSVPPTTRKIMDDVAHITGFYPDTYCINSFDAVQIFSQAYDIAGSDESSLIKAVLPSVCESFGYSGISRRLNDAGDLETANFIFYAVYTGQTGYYWDSYATYMAEGDYILIK